MAFVRPTLNLTCNVWRQATWVASWPPTIPAPDLAGVPCQLRGTTQRTPINVFTVHSEYCYDLIVAIGTDLRDPRFNSNEYPYWADRVEVPAGSGRYYLCMGVADQAKGFSNEYRVGLLDSTEWSHGTYWAFLAHAPYAPSWPVPYP